MLQDRVNYLISYRSIIPAISYDISLAASSCGDGVHCSLDLVCVELIVYFNMASGVRSDSRNFSNATSL